MAKVVTMGEMMMRLVPPNYKKITQTNTLDITYGGGEANVAIGLSNFGHDSYLVSRMPNDALGDGVINFLRGFGVKDNFIERSGENLGLYFLEMGYSARPSQVVYNRKNSAFTKINSSMFDFDAIMKDANWFHISGIMLALGEDVRNTLLEALKKAREYNVKVSLDFNFRSKLWNSAEESRPFYRELLQYVNVCFSSFYDFNTIIGIETKEEDIEKRRFEIFNKAMKEFNIDYIFDRDRVVHNANNNSLNAICFKSDETVSRIDSIRFDILDRIGGGDAFSAGTIDSLLKDYYDGKRAALYGLASSVLKHALPGDVCNLTKDEVERFVLSGGSGDAIR